jgi:predicted dehydrogenase
LKATSSSLRALRVGVVGCGYWGSKHIRVLHGLTGVDEVMAIEPREERVESLQRTFRGLSVFGDLTSALDHLDAVVIATPPRTHARLALAAIAAGKSVLVEKPLATTTADARRMLEAAAEQGVTLMTGHTFEYNSAVWTLRDLLQSGELGNIFYLDSARLNLGLYQADVNVVWDLAPHDVSIFNYILGAQPSTVEAWGSRHAHQYLEDVAYLRLHYPELGATGHVHVSWLDPSKVRRVTAVGSKKMAVYDDLSADDRVRVYDKGVVAVSDGANLQNAPLSYRYGEIRSPYIDFQEPLSYQDQHFVSCVSSGRRPQTDGRNGLAVVQILEAAERSLREGRPIDIEPVYPNGSRGVPALAYGRTA